MRDFIFDPNSQRDQRIFYKFVLISLAIHLVVFVYILFSSYFMPNPIEKKLTFVEARLVRFGTRKRNKRYLPRIYKRHRTVSASRGKGNTLKKVKKNVVKHSRKKVKKKKKIHNKGEDLESFLNSAIASATKEDKRAEESDEGDPNGVVGGDVTDPSLAIKGNMYIRKINAIIRNYWKIPSILKGKDISSLKTEVFFRVTFSGEIYSVRVVHSSGNPVFDSSVVEAIKKVNKIPLPSDRNLRKFVLKEGLQWVFVPQ